MLDIAVAYNRYKFLGEEFLTWLWFTIENTPDVITQIDSQIKYLQIGNRIVLENRSQERKETISIKGDDAGLQEGMLALKKGAMVTEIKLMFKAQDDYEWHFSIKGENLSLSSIKLPQTGTVESKDDIEGAILERIYLNDKTVHLIRELFRYFIKKRISSSWKTNDVLHIKNWVDKNSDFSS